MACVREDMLEIRNRTPFATALVPFQDASGFDHAVVVVKGTFRIGGAAPPAVAGEQLPLLTGDEHYGEAGTSSVRFECDLGPAKPGTDVVLNGHAYAPRGEATEADVTLRVGRLQKTVRVFGDRVYVRAAGRWHISKPLSFARMPLRYERAFGGADTSRGEPGAHPFEPRNTIGVGFVAPGSTRDLDGQRLPNVEDPAALISEPGQRPPPAGFGFIARHWAPRVSFAGTYDERWRRERCPLLPDDFDTRFLLGAHPDLVSRSHLRGGEPVEVIGASPGAPLSFALPTTQLDVKVTLRGEETRYPAVLDTVVIEPDEARLALTWRTMVPCGRKLLYIDRIDVQEAGA